MAANLKAVPDADAPPAPQAAHPLTAVERNALIGLQARHDEYARIINEAEREIMDAIEARLGVAIGATHTIDPRTWTVAPIPRTAADVPA